MSTVDDLDRVAEVDFHAHAGRVAPCAQHVEQVAAAAAEIEHAGIGLYGVQDDAEFFAPLVHRRQLGEGSVLFNPRQKRMHNLREVIDCHKESVVAVRSVEPAI